MYKLLLCWRYLRTRYLALACIISVMLGVATLIVVNSVMSGFSTKLRDRLHGLLSDVVVEGMTLDGFPHGKQHVERIRQSPIGDQIEAMTSTVEIFAMLQFRYRGQMVTRPVRLLGVDPVERSTVGGFSEFLVRQKKSATPSFEIPAEAKWRYHQNHPPLTDRGLTQAAFAGLVKQGLPGNDPPPPDPPQPTFKMPRGIILGNAIASYRMRDAQAGQENNDKYILELGDDVVLTTVSAGKMVPVYDRFVICDYFKSEMSEYDGNYVFVPLDYLQHLRAMDDRVTSIQIKLKDFKAAPQVVAELRAMFPEQYGFMVQTWEDKQGPLLAAISIEKGILNILLFLIIAVAGFGILAIFSMIVVEKTRDIGILKALGASNRGIMSIFLGYGLLLGVVGAALGTGLGIWITVNINEIEQWLTRTTGHDIFDRKIYYFSDIPTDIQPWTVLFVNLGAIAIAVGASILPALRAALLHPVRALRYE
ncbi:MAG: ABC transporter permease [Planctomycetia bacterium]|nr:ABC transporter permease [Planctomycetia bacterium]